MKLTNKEASEWLIAIKRDYIYGGDEDYDKRRKIALDMGAEALENQKSVVEELEKIKADFVEQRKDFGLTKNDSDYDLGSFDSYNYAITTIDYRIAELKGESNE